MKENKSNRFKKINLIKFSILILIIIGIILIGISLIPYINNFATKEGRDSLVALIRGQGILGVLAFIALQILQVVIFIIPGEFIEVIGGILYGTWWGYAICMIGVILGSTVIYYLVKWLGYEFITEFVPEKEFQKLNFLKKEKNITLLVFILFFIPGTPKDALTYFIPFTNLPLKKFLIISTLARIPSVISSTFVGSSLQSQNITVAIVAYACIGIAALIGIVVNKKFMKKYND